MTQAPRHCKLLTQPQLQERFGVIDGGTALTAQQVTDVTEVGFSVSANLRVEDLIADGFDEAPSLAPGIMVAMQDLGVWYVLALGQDASGDTTFAVKGGYNLGTVVSGTVAGSGYHDYDLRYSSYVGSADLFVDGVEVISDIPSTTSIAGSLGNRVRWGAEDSPGMGAGYWTSIALETAPATITPETLPTIINPYRQYQPRLMKVGRILLLTVKVRRWGPLMMAGELSGKRSIPRWLLLPGRVSTTKRLTLLI